MRFELSGWPIAALLLSVSLSTPLRADDAAQPAAQTPTTHQVAKGPLRIELTLDGAFDAADKQEIILRPQSWTEWTVREAVAQGAKVKAGDVVLKFDSSKLEEAIKDLEAALKAADLTLRQEEADYALLQQISPLDMQAAERAKEAADEDLKHFLESDRELRIKSADFSLKHSKEQLEYVTEELKQLEKMYKADDLYEDTEEIILKRQRSEVEAARFSLESAQASHLHTLKTTLPRQEAALRDAAQRATIALDKLKLSAPVTITKTGLELEKLRGDRTRNAEKLDKLRQDLPLMSIKAARAGVVYFGVLKNGQLATAAAVAPKLDKGSAAMANEVLLTIVSGDAVQVHANAAENTLHQMRAGLKGRVTPTAYPGVRLPVTMQSAPAYPDASGKYDVTLAVDPAVLSGLERRPVPGMTCQVKLIAYDKADALTIPLSALQSDDTNGKTYVTVSGADGKPERRDVQTGQTSGDRIEITAGLADGDKVVMPGADKK